MIGADRELGGKDCAPSGSGTGKVIPMIPSNFPRSILISICDRG